ncbi:MAG: hypothetical protein HRU21_00865 [Pseudomonadales bacterium]|nr:hypothetical protein [Pseudomonadales bacterium]
MIKIIKPYFCCFWLILSLVALQALAQEAAFYRYKDANGNIVISRYIPPDRVSEGYEILSDTGRVVEVVDKQLSDEQLNQLTLAEKENEAKQLKQQVQREYDLQLLRRYSAVVDIESERDRKIFEMNNRLQILNANLLGVQNELEAEYVKAARLEKSGNIAAEQNLKRIEELESNLTTTKQIMENLNQDILQTKTDYLKAIDRFKELKLLRQ